MKVSPAIHADQNMGQMPDQVATPRIIIVEWPGVASCFDDLHSGCRYAFATASVKPSSVSFAFEPVK